MSQTATVKQVQSAGGNDNFKKWEITLDNGVSGYQFSKKDKCFVNQGDTIEYTTGQFKDGSTKIEVVKKVAGPSVNAQAANASTNENRLELDKQKFELERKKQLFIIRQSSLQRAIEYINFFGSDATDTVNAVLDMTDVFVDYVINGRKK